MRRLALALSLVLAGTCGAQGIYSPGGGGGLTAAQTEVLALLVKNGSDLEISAPSGGDVVIKEHADDGGSEMFHGSVNGNTDVRSASGSQSVRIYQQGNLIMVLNGTHITHERPVRDTPRADPGVPATNYIYRWNDSTSGDYEIRGSTTGPTALFAGP